MPSQQQTQLQEHQTPKIVVDDDQRNKEQSQQQQQQQQQQLQQNSNSNNNNNNNLNLNTNNSKLVMEKCLRKGSEKCNPSLLSASTQLLKEATVAALLQRNKQCASTTSCSDASNASFSSTSVADSVQDDMSDQCSLTQAGLEEYNIRASSYYDQPALFHHQKQSSYAQSEGYHSYVSSSDSSSATPFLDRLRQESEMLSRQSSHHWSQNDLSSVSCASAAPSPTPTSLLLSTVNSMSNGGERADGLLGETDKNAPTTISTTPTVGGNGNHQHRQQQQQQQQQQQPQHHNNNNNNNTTSNNNSSESTSSTETLKWLGSMSDVSEASHATGYSAVSESGTDNGNGLSTANSTQQCDDVSLFSEASDLAISNSQLIVHSSRVLTPKRHHSESVLYLSTEQQLSPHANPIDENTTQQHYQHQQNSTQQTISKSSSVNHRHSPSYPPIHSTLSLQPYHQHYYQQQKTTLTTSTSWTTNDVPIGEIATSSLIINKQQTYETTSLPNDLDKQPKAHKSSISVTLSNNEIIATETSPIININSTIEKLEAWETNSAVNRELEDTTIPTSLTTNINRSNHRLFPVSTYTEHSNTSQFIEHPKPQFSAGLQKTTTANICNGGVSQSNNISPKSLQQSQTSSNWHSVAELINDFERTNEQQPPKYAFMDPNKTQRISNPALKAFQKNAVQSYFERQQQQSYPKEKNQQQTHNQQQQYQHILRPHSFQATASVKEVNSYELLRSSLPNTYHRHQAISPKQMQQQQHHHQQQQSKDQQQMFNESRRLSSSLSGVQIPMQQDLTYSTSSLADDEETKRNFRQSVSPEPPPPPPRSRSLMPISLLRRSSSASDYAEFREQYKRATQEKLQSQSIKNISSAEKSSFNDCGMPPAPPPRGRIAPPERRTSSASEYAAMRDKLMLQQAAARAHQHLHPHQYGRQQHSNQRGTIANLNPNYHYMPMPQNVNNQNEPPPGWVPERPPKNPNLRVPSPDLPPPPTDIDGNLIGSDEPLPPPPPEILHRQPFYDFSTKSGANQSPNPSQPSQPPPPPVTSQQSTVVIHGVDTPNRRNSFAGSSNRKVSYYSTDGQSKGPPPPPPPLIPKKPAHIEHIARPAYSSGNSFHQKKPTSVIFSNKAQPQSPSPANLFNQSHNNSQIQVQNPNQNRKRPHNPGMIINVPPIPENIATTNLKRNESSSPLLPARPAPPLPLKPRSIATGHSSNATQNVSGAELRCNSKASYLPRQSLEKLNNSDPDHGSYKLTLTSNEDLVNNTNLTKPSISNSYDILSVQNGKIPQNLPDVLPLGAKLQQPHPASPTGGKISPLRYTFGSNSSIASSQQQLPYPLQHRYSSPAMGANGSTYHPTTTVAAAATTTTTPNYLRSQSYDMHNDTIPGNKSNKYMSQSTIDLKSTRIQTLDTTHEEECSPTNIEKSQNPILSPAQSESNISNSSILQKQLNSNENSSNNNNNNNSRPIADGRIFRAELVSTTLPQSSQSMMGSGNSLNKSVITRRDSLRENIEKITQLQSQLMSAHLTDSGYSLSGYGGKSIGNSSNTASLEKLTSFDNCSAINKTQTIDESNKTPPPTTTTTIEEKPVVNQLSQLHQESTENRNAITISVQTSTQSPEQMKSSHEISSVFNGNDTVESLSPIDCSDEGSLKLMQRSELIVRVNPTLMIEASCQTDDLTEADDEMLRLALPQQLVKENQQCPRTTLQPRQRHPIEIDCDNMCKELAMLLPSNDKLINIILPQGTKSASDYVDDLYNPNVPLRPTKHDVGTSTLMRMKLRDRGEAKNLITVELQYSDIDMNPLSSETATEGCDILKGKVNELMKELKRKICVLGNEQTTIEEESAINDELGSSLIKKFAEKVRPIEATKFRTYIDDIGHITSLLLSLSERLARLENSLSEMEENSAERKTLESKRDRLLEQLEEAKRLKGDIDRRGSGLTGVLEKNLNADDFADFDYFINMKAKLIADSRDISDKIKCGEEQLNALNETLLQSDC